MSTQGIDDYNIKQKNDWRGWAWNRLIERLPVPVEQARVLYLCGPEDHDRAAGLGRGIQNDRLIAVDSDRANIAKVRANGGIGVVGDLALVVASAPEAWPIHGVLADYCGGLSEERSSPRLIYAVARSRWQRVHPIEVAVVANLQRGRDWYHSNKWDLGEHTEDMESVFRARLQSTARSSAATHRGLVYYFQHLCWLADQPGSARLSLSDVLLHEDPAFFSYCASRVYMDSVAMRLPAFVAPRCRTNPDLVRQWAAVKATVTRRSPRSAARVAA